VEDAEEKQVPASRNTRNVESVSKKVIATAVFGGLPVSGGEVTIRHSAVGFCIFIETIVLHMMVIV
jgi:hypothetical protein